MPDQLIPSALARGFVKANLVHHLAHVGGREVLLRIGRAAAPMPWLPRASARALEICAIPTPDLKASDLEGLEPVWRGLNALRLWDGDKHFKTALDAFEELVAGRPDWDWAYLLRGEAKRSLLDYEGALADLSRVEHLAWGAAFKARVLFQSRTEPKDLRWMDRAIKLSPREGWMRCWRGESYRRLGDLKRAEKDLRDGLRDDPLYDQGYSWLAKLLLARGEAVEAEALVRKGIELCPQFEKAYRPLVAALRLQGRTDEALAALDQAAALNHRNNWLGVWRVEGYSSGDVPPGRWGGETLGQLGRHEEALARLGAETHPWAAAWRGESLLKLGRRVEALRELDAACAGDQDYGRAHAWRGRALADEGRWAEALEAYEAALGRRRIEYAWLNAWKGEALLQLGRVDEARRELDAAVLLDPNCPAFRVLRAKTRDEAGAREDLLAAVGRRRDAESYLLRYWLLKAEKPGLARRHLDQAFRIDPSVDAPIPEDAGVLAYRRDLKSLRRAVELEPRTGWILAWYGEALRKDGKLGEALAVLDRAVAADPKYENARFWRGTVRLALGDKSGALEDLKRPTTARAYMDRWRAGGDVRDLEKALHLNPDLRCDPPTRLAPSYRARTVKEARAALKKAPTFALAWAALAEALGREGKLDQARKAIRRAVKLAPYSAPLRLKLARLEKGRASTAALEAARRLQPNARLEEKALEFFVNYACNAKCPFCFNPPDDHDKGLPLRELVRRLMKGWAEGYRSVKFIGGEATVRDDFPKLVAAARKIGYSRIQLTTNGVRLGDPAYARRVAALGLTDVRFSIHGHTPQLHDSQVLIPGALEKIKRATAVLRERGVRLGVNYVLSKLNVREHADTIEWLMKDMGFDDVIVYFVRYQGFAELNYDKLALTFTEAAPAVREAFRRLGGGAKPALIHFPPCVLPELEEHMLDWRRRPEDTDLVTLPDGSGGRIEDVTNSGKVQVAACSRCDRKDVCHGVESRYVARHGELEFA